MKKQYKYRKYEPIAKTGLESVDNHHLKYIQQINDLVDILNGEKEKKELLTIFHKILYYAETYFIDEEMFYQKNNYTNLIAHKQQHKEFVEKISEFKEAFQNNEEGICVKIMKFLDRWYKEHILKEDKNATENI